MGAKMVDFAGWYMPVQYDGVKEEHLACRTQVGLFDVSHMGELRVRGPKSLEALEWFTTNDVAKLKAGEAQYSLFPNESGGIVDDLIVYCLTPGEDYLLCVNASNVEKDFAYVLKHNRGADITNESERWAQIAVQGPKAIALLQKVISPEVAQIQTFHFRELKFSDKNILVARTGYTGEDGAEIFLPAELAVAFWTALLNQGREFAVKPVGLGARDTLRTEMKYSLYGHEIDDTTNPYSAGLGWVVKPAKKDFVGKSAMLKQKEQGILQKLVGFELQDRGIPRQGYEVFSFDNNKIGKVTSGTMSPSTGLSIGIAYVDLEFAETGKELNIDIRGRKTKAKIVPTPFVKSGLNP